MEAASRKSFLALVVLLPALSTVATTWTAPASAQSASVPQSSPTKIATEGNLGLGWMGLPGAPICSSGGCITSDSSFLFHLKARVHFFNKWAVGAGADLALFPTSHPPLSREAESVGRKLSRSYLVATGHVLYFPWRPKARAPGPSRVDFYLGGDLGLALLSDRYRSPAFDDGGAIRIGEPGSIVRSEGLIGRGLVGGDLGLTSYLALGLGAQLGAVWFPEEESTTFEDPASLSGLAPWLSITIDFKVYLEL